MLSGNNGTQLLKVPPQRDSLFNVNQLAQVDANHINEQKIILKQPCNEAELKVA